MHNTVIIVFYLLVSKCVLHRKIVAFLVYNSSYAIRHCLPTDNQPNHTVQNKDRQQTEWYEIIPNASYHVYANFYYL